MNQLGRVAAYLSSM